MEPPFVVAQIVRSALDLKARDLKQIDMAGKSSLADHILICHGTSTAHTRGIADQISMDLKKEGVLPLGMEGYDTGEWILVDFNSTIMHIFLEESRLLYNLEDIYNDFESRTFE
jgi:ribosome-associated protein